MKYDTTSHSDFWLDDFDFDVEDDAELNEQSNLTASLIRLSMARRAIANFVSILTGKTIPVLFNDSGHNMTDGSVVYISSDIDETGDFDSSVGLALHEGSHVAFTDFRVVVDLWQNIPRELYNIAEPKGFTKQEVAEFVKIVLNIIEDRYIDNYVYTTAPGYRGYYLALYEKYFNNANISTMLKSQMYRSKTIESYEARLINITNKDTELDALPDFRKIAELIDLNNINRLKTTQDRLNLAIEVCKIIYANVDLEEQKQRNKKVAGNSSDDGESNNGGNTVIIVSGENGSSSNIDDVIGGTDSNVVSVTSENSKTKTEKENENSGVAKSKRSAIERALKKQREFTDGKIKKKKVTAAENRILEELEAAGVTMIPVGYNLNNGNGAVSSVDCVVVKNLTKELIFSDQFPCKWIDDRNLPHPDTNRAVNDGLRLGNMLGRKLMVRNELNTTKYMRKSVGRIDRRVLAELGFDNENVFYKNVTDQYKSAYIHISVDASSSMGGNSWSKTITAVTAICKAASMIRNLRVSVSLRSTCKDGHLPYVVMVYDSAKDHFTKVRNLFPYLHPFGSTPEGLCYEAIMDMLGEKSSEEDYYFLNFSDGEPAYYYQRGPTFISYGSDNGGEHTRIQVNKIRNKGYKVLSYFISKQVAKYMMNTGSDACFKKMYGQDASFIDVGNIISVAKTMNKMFLDKKY